MPRSIWAMSLAGLGELDEAIVHFQKAVDLRPDWEVARRNSLGPVREEEGPK